MTPTPQHIVIFVTAKDQDEARSIAGKLLEEKLIACANIADNVESLFWWEGKIDRAGEVLLVLKSRAALLEKIVAAVKAAHSYDVPEVIAMPIIGGNPDYLKWVDESTAA
jgi:periplasmic divalent cation tolerance protein